MTRLPLRLRLALVFALAMAVVLVAVGAVLYLSVREALNDQIAENALDWVEATEERDETLATLLTLLLVVGPIALLLASFAGYWLAGAALRPVEAMRRGAAEISASTSGHRLPLPPASDEVRRLGETLNAMLARLDDGLERERRFVADAGHELRTPLAALRSELELALRQPRASQELVAALHSAAEEVERLVRLAENLLVLSRDGESGPPLQRTRVEVSDLLETVAGRFRRPDRAIEVVVPAGSRARARPHPARASARQPARQRPSPRPWHRQADG